MGYLKDFGPKFDVQKEQFSDSEHVPVSDGLFSKCCSISSHKLSRVFSFWSRKILFKSSGSSVDSRTRRNWYISLKIALPNFFVSDNFEINLGKYSSKLIRISFSRIILVSSDVEDRQHAFQKRLKSGIYNSIYY